jgi:hypothetical protein
MSTVKTFRNSEFYTDVTSIKAHKFNSTTSSYEPTTIEFGTIVSNHWAIGSPDTYKSTFGWPNPLSTTPSSSSNIKITWTQGSAPGGSVPIIADFRRDHPTNNIPKSKCKVTFYNPKIKLGGKILYTYSSVGGSAQFIHRINYTILYNNSIQTFGPTDIAFSYSSQGSSGSTSLPESINTIPMSNLTQKGSLVTGGESNDLDNINFQIRLLKSGYLPGSPSHQVAPEITFDGYQVAYEGNNYIIDGVNGDTGPAINVISSFVATASIIHSGKSNPSTVSSINGGATLLRLASSNLSSNFTTSIIGNVKSDIEDTLSVTTEVLATTNNFVFGSATIDSTFTQSQIPTLITNVYTSLSFNFSQTTLGSLIYDALGGDYTWDSLTGSWDEWPDNIWVPAFARCRFAVDKTVSFKPGTVLTLNGVFTTAENSGLNQPAQADLQAVFSISPTAQGIIDQGSAMTSTFNTTALANNIYDALAQFNGVLSAELLANIIYANIFATPASQFSLSLQPTFKPGGEVDMSAAFEILDKLANMIYDADAGLSAFNFVISAGRLQTQADPYNIAKVLNETRKILIAMENRKYIIPQEIRLNTIKAETRNILVPDETRKFRLKVAPMTNRFATPKVRSSI